MRRITSKQTIAVFRRYRSGLPQGRPDRRHLKSLASRRAREACPSAIFSWSETSARNRFRSYLNDCPTIRIGLQIDSLNAGIWQNVLAHASTSNGGRRAAIITSEPCFHEMLDAGDERHTRRNTLGDHRLKVRIVRRTYPRTTTDTQKQRYSKQAEGSGSQLGVPDNALPDLVLFPA